MSKYNIPLNNIKVAAPCPADWNGMVGNDRVRFCGQCSLNVYNLSSMSRKEAEDLIQSTEGRLCVRFYQRKDGTVLTDNCPVGLRAIKRRVNRIASAAISAVLSFAAGLGLASALTEQEVPNVMGKMAPREAVMGDVVVPQTSIPEPLMGQPVGTPQNITKKYDNRNYIMGRYPVEPATRVKNSSKRNRKH